MFRSWAARFSNPTQQQAVDVGRHA